jgi:hypothetical protein
MNRHRISIIALVSTSMLLLFTPSSSYAASTQTIKTLYLSITVPTQISMPKKECSTFKLSYTLGLKAKQAGFGYSTIGLLIDDDLAAGLFLSYNLGVGDSPEKGTAQIKYCKNDWETEDGDARIGAVPGTHSIGFVTKYGGDAEKWGKIKIVK